MANYRFWAILLIFGSIVLGYFVYNTENEASDYRFKLGLDLSGGTQLVYTADTSEAEDRAEAMRALRDAIERRINVFGVSEPIIQTERAGLAGAGEDRLIVELPGVTDVEEAIDVIGKTPILEFKLLKDNIDTQNLSPENINDAFEATGITGQMLERASVQFNQQSVANRPIIVLNFNEQGTELFAQVTGDNVGRVMGIFLDGNLIEAPAIREEIKGGEATITGDFELEQAKQLVRDLNFGALPVPINLLSTQSIGATLGEQAVDQSVKAGLIALVAVGLFLVAWYRLPGLVAVLALAIYTVINLSLFKLIPVVLTTAGIAGLVLSIGMAVDANILIFERTREELKRGKSKSEAINEGFKRAWNSIRDSNLSSIITAIILYYFASTPVIRGFALVFLIGVLVSMFSAITASRTILFALNREK